MGMCDLVLNTHKVEDSKGDLVIVTMKGEFLPYKKRWFVTEGFNGALVVITLKNELNYRKIAVNRWPEVSSESVRLARYLYGMTRSLLIT